jgi:titin
VRNGSVSAYSNTATVAITVPNAPSGLSATAARAGANDTVTLLWTDNSTNNTSFTLQRSTNATFTTNVVTTNNIAANATTYTQNGVPRQTTYYYRIRAVSPAGTSPWSNVFTITTP